MRDATRGQAMIIPQEILLQRLEQSEDLREFTIQMWLQNPQLARQGGMRVIEIMTPLDELTSATEIQ